MNELIRRQDAIDAVSKAYRYESERMTALQNVPIVEAFPVVYAKWHSVYENNIGAKVGFCSNCGYQKEVDNFCGNCGARMKEVSDMSKTKLLPCPFCGIQLENDPPSSFWYHPQNGCLLSMRGIAGKEQFTAWNTRKPLERIVDQLEEMFDRSGLDEGKKEIMRDIIKKKGCD